MATHPDLEVRGTVRPVGDWHARPVEDVLAALDVDADTGLPAAEARARLVEHGPNRLTAAGGTPWWRTLIGQFLDPLITILLLAGLLTLALGKVLDTAVIAAVLALNAAIGFAQERRAEASVLALMQLVSPKARLLRDGQAHTVEAAEVVPGDVVLLQSGERIPADLRLVATSSLHVDESLLTGESVPVAKGIAPAVADAPVAERTSMAFSGATVVSGRGRGVVVATGEDTELGRIAVEVREAEVLRSPLQRRMRRFAEILGLVIGLSVGLTFVFGLALGHDLAEMLLVAAALAVAAVPEGLPVVLTVALALGVRRMAQRNAIVRRLPAVETLGSTTLIGSDKTGTLTQNRMAVAEVNVAGTTHLLLGDTPSTAAPARSSEEAPGAEADPFTLALLAGVLANEATLRRVDGQVMTQGDPTEVALLLAASREGIDPVACRDAWKEVAAIPFESERRYAASYRQREDLHLLAVKGAPERVLEMCAAQAGPEGREALDHQAAVAAAQDMAARGLRVLATAYRLVEGPPADTAHPPEPGGLVLLGLHGLVDPPREGVREAIATCQRAGQRVIMITGDHAATARAIALQLGIVTAGRDRVLTGPDLDAVDDAALAEELREVNVFARVSPFHKLRVVEAARALGHVVAVTGDGVNDAPALKRADIGVAMGQAGTDVAREASELVLADDNFVSIEAAIEEGRVTFDNVRKVTFFLVSTGVGTFLVVPVSILLGWPLILLPAQLLWANLITKGLQDLSLAFEPGEPDVLARPPLGRNAPVITRPLWWRTALTGLVIAVGTLVMFGWALQQPGYTLEQAQTVALTTLVVFQAFHLLSSRSELRSVFTMPLLSNRFLILAQLGALAVHVGALHLPATQYVLRVAPVPGEVWLRMVAIALTVLVVVELDKLVRRRRAYGRGGRLG